MKKSATPLSAEELAEFETFWACWPRRDARLDALKAWAQTRHARPAIEALTTAVRNATVTLEWSADRRTFIPLAATWLRAERWTDEACQPKAITSFQDVRMRALAAWSQIRAANNSADPRMPAGGWGDALTAPAFKAMGGFGALRDMTMRDVGVKAREFYEHFKAQAAIEAAAAAAVPVRAVGKPALRLVPKAPPLQADLLEGATTMMRKTA